MYKLALFTFLSIVTLVGVNVLILEHLRDFKFSDLAPILLWINFNLLLILILLSVFVKKFYKEWRQESSPLKGKIFAFLLGIIGIPYVLITALAIGGKASYLRVFTDKTLKEIVIYADKLQRELNNLPPKEKEKLFKDLEHFKESVSTVRKIIRKQKVVLINFLLFFTLFFLVILIAAISFASWLAGAISSFIEELTKVTKEVAKGKFDVKLSEKEFPFSGLKELKELAQSFNEMVKSVGEAFKRLERDKILFEKIFQKVSTGVALFDNKDKELIKANEGYLKHFKFSNLEKLRRWVNGRDTLRYEELNIGRLTLVILEDLMPFVINKRYRAWKEMAMGLAHDIKNPLNNILVNLSYLEYLLDRYGADGDCNLDELKKEFKGKFSSIERQINYISTLLDRFNEFATGEGELKREVFSLKELLFEVKRANERENCHIFIEGDNLFLKANRNSLKRVFENLIKNSCEAIESSGRKNGVVRIRVKGNLIHIEDNGPGIPPDKVESIFLPFTSSKKGSGRGLGLFIVKKIIEEHGWNIRLMPPEEGKGAHFVIKVNPSDIVKKYP